MDKLKILVIGCHPADVFDHCGGTLARHIKRGDQVTALSITTGSRVHNDTVYSLVKNKRKSERPDPEKLNEILQKSLREKNKDVIEACEILGITDVRFLDYDDKILMETREIVESVAKAIRSIRPDIIITHYPLADAGISNPHAIAGKMVMNAFIYAGQADYDDENPPHWASQIFFMTAGDSLFKGNYLAEVTTFNCNTFIDITDVIELKLKAGCKMKSQQYGEEYSKKALEATDGLCGLFMGVPYAEAFIRYYPDIAGYLTVSNELRERANEPELEKLERKGKLIVPFVKI